MISQALYSASSDTLEKSEVMELIVKAQAGDLEARNRVVMTHMRAVMKFAHKFSVNSRYSANDLISVGCLGLMEAIKRFEVDRGLAFLTFAYHWIRKEILEFKGKNKTVVRVPKGSRQSRMFRSKAVNDAMDVADSPAFASHLCDLTCFTYSSTVEEKMDLEYLAGKLDYAIESLTKLEQHVIRGRLAGKMLREIGLGIDCNFQKTSRIERTAMKRLTELMGA